MKSCGVFIVVSMNFIINCLYFLDLYDKTQGKHYMSILRTLSHLRYLHFLWLPLVDGIDKTIAPYILCCRYKYCVCCLDGAQLEAELAIFLSRNLCSKLPLHSDFSKCYDVNIILPIESQIMVKPTPQSESRNLMKYSTMRPHRSWHVLNSYDQM